MRSAARAPSSRDETVANRDRTPCSTSEPMCRSGTTAPLHVELPPATKPEFATGLVGFDTIRVTFKSGEMTAA